MRPRTASRTLASAAPGLHSVRACAWVTQRAGHATRATRVETGAVTGVHRAGASLNVHVHFPRPLP